MAGVVQAGGDGAEVVVAKLVLAKFVVAKDVVAGGILWAGAFVEARDVA